MTARNRPKLGPDGGNGGPGGNVVLVAEKQYNTLSCVRYRHATIQQYRRATMPPIFCREYTAELVPASPTSLASTRLLAHRGRWGRRSLGGQAGGGGSSLGPPGTGHGRGPGRPSRGGWSSGRLPGWSGGDRGGGWPRLPFLLSLLEEFLLVGQSHPPDGLLARFLSPTGHRVRFHRVEVDAIA